MSIRLVGLFLREAVGYCCRHVERELTDFPETRLLPYADTVTIELFAERLR